MQGTLATSSPPSVIGTEVAETDTSFLEVLGSFLKNGPFFANYSTSHCLDCPVSSSRQPQWRCCYLQLLGYCFSGPVSSFSSQDTPFFYLCKRSFRAQRTRNGVERGSCYWLTLLPWAWTPWCGVPWRWFPESAPLKRCCGTGDGPWDNGHPIPGPWCWTLGPLWPPRWLLFAPSLQSPWIPGPAAPSQP